jgi:agmatine deiminase
MAPGCVFDFLNAPIGSASSSSELGIDVADPKNNRSALVPAAGSEPVAGPFPNSDRTAASADSSTETANRKPPHYLSNAQDHWAIDATNLDTWLGRTKPESLSTWEDRPDFATDHRNTSLLGVSSGIALPDQVLSRLDPQPTPDRGLGDAGSSWAPEIAGPPRTNPWSSSDGETHRSMLGAGVSSETSSEESRIPRGLPYGRGADPVQSLTPYAIPHNATDRAPTTGVVQSPAEYDPMRGVLFSYRNYSSIVTDMVKELTEDASKDEIAYVVVSSAAQQDSAASSFTNAGADMSKVQFFIQPSDSVWIRDYGPHFITVDDSLAIVDSHYYPNRPQDNFMPTLLGDSNFHLPSYDMGLYYSGGNFQPGPNNTGFVTSLVNYHNTATDGFNESFISELYHTYQGIETLHVLPQLPFSVDATGHIDMWMYLVDEDTVMISEFKAGSNSTAIQITNNAVTYMQNLGFSVYRVPAWNAGSTHYTYANAFRVNDRIFVPVYGTELKPGGNSSYNDEDAAAMATWQQAAGPDVEIIPIQSNQIIPAAGAIHCIVKQVPRYTQSAPAANIISPAGGEFLLKGSQHRIEWSAIDTNNVDPATISLSVSYDGRTYHPIATTMDTGSYMWTVSNRATRQATIKLVAQSSDNDEIEVVSDPFTIADGTAVLYDFASGAGVNKFAYGSQTSAWANINGNPSPVGTPLNSANYAGISTSNATGGDSDSNRYIAPVPNPLGNESTHVFSFTLSEAIQTIAQIEVDWEGYADFSTQVEL